MISYILSFDRHTLLLLSNPDFDVIVCLAPVLPCELSTQGIPVIFFCELIFVHSKLGYYRRIMHTKHGIRTIR